MLHPDRLLPPDPGVRRIAQRIHETTAHLPIVSPHGHVDPTVLADNEPIGDPATELITRDHYVLRMLYSQGISLEALGVAPLDDATASVPSLADGRDVWRTVARHYRVFAGTPSRLWLDHTLSEVFGVDEPLNAATADAIYDHLSESLTRPEFAPRALFDRFNIELLATTDSALDDLAAHARIEESGWTGEVIPTFRPDDVTDPDNPGFRAGLDALAEATGGDTTTWDGYLAALRQRRDHFIDAGANATDHGPPSALTVDLSRAEAERLFARVISGRGDEVDAELFRAQMLVEMAAMSVEDGLVLQLHAGSWRRHNPTITARFGPDMGNDIPQPMDYVGGLKALLDRFGNDPNLTVVVYTLDESTYGRELAPLAGHYPALKLGPPWWFFDSPAGMRRWRELVTETAGFANTVGFNDDARSLLTIPARHDVARRVDAGFLANLVAEHRLDEDEAIEVAADLAYELAKRTFGS